MLSVLWNIGLVIFLLGLRKGFCVWIYDVFKDIVYRKILGEWSEIIYD